jgi:DNA-binding NarL/FixJ family response regulator
MQIRFFTVELMSATSALTATERKLRILIADDHALIGKTVRAVLEEDPRFEVCGEAFNGAAAIEETSRLRPDVVVLNVVMPVLNGLEAAKVIKSKLPATVIVILSSDADEEFVKQAKKAGAQAYVSKSRAGDALISAIEAALPGGEFVFVE